MIRILLGRPTGTSLTLLKGHMPVLDGVRGLAIWLVVFMHFFGNNNPNNFFERVSGKLAGFGVFGLDLFFLLSGFLISGILWDSKDSPSFFRSFIFRRFLRIFPLYYGVLIIIYWFLPHFDFFQGEDLSKLLDLESWTWSYLVNLKIAREGVWIFPYISHFWSLAVEEHFYVIWPWAIYFLSRKYFLVFCGVFIVAGIVARLGLRLNQVNELAVYVLTPCRFDSLCAGSFVAVLLRDGREEPYWAARLRIAMVVMILACIGLFLISSSLQSKSDFISYRFWRDLFYWCFFFASFMGIIGAQIGSIIHKIFSNGVLVFLGKYSYGLYVFHGIIHWHFEKINFRFVLNQSIQSATLSYFLQGIIGVAISVVVAYLSYHLYEKHFLKFKKYFNYR